MESDEKQNKSDKEEDQGKEAQQVLQQDFQGQEIQQDHLIELADGILELGLQQDCQGQEHQEPLLNHFFSGLADRNLDHVLTKIISYLSGDGIRNCLWTCRALRQAVMADKEAMKKEDTVFFSKLPQGNLLRTRKVSDPFKMSSENIISLTTKLGETTETEANALLQEAVGRGTFKEPIPITRTSGGTSGLHLTFGLDYEDKVCSALGFGNKEYWKFTPLEKGDLVMVEKKDDGKDGCMTTECWIVRVDDNEGKILDKWYYLDIVDEDDVLHKEISYDCYGTAKNVGESYRRGNKVFYIHRKYWILYDYVKNINMMRRLYIFAIMVDLDIDKVLWRKWVGYGLANTHEAFISDNVCGFVMNDGGLIPQRLVRFDIETGAEILPDLSDGQLQFGLGPGLRGKLSSITPGRDVVALISAVEKFEFILFDSQVYMQACPPTGLARGFTCQLLHARTGSPLRNRVLLPPTDSGFFFGETRQAEERLMPTSVLFGDRILAMCVLEEMTTDIASYTWHLENKKVDACVLTAREYKFDGFESVAPSITGNIWFLLSSEESKDGDKSEYTLHAVDINKSVSGFWEMSQHSNSSVK